MIAVCGQTRFSIVLLGTASADLYPAPFCDCEHCRVAREHGGRDLRKFCCAYIAPDLLIDCPPDVVVSAMHANVSLHTVTKVLVTHSHPDHFASTLLLLRRANLWAEHRRYQPREHPVPPLTPLTIYGNARVVSMMREWLMEHSKNDLKIETVKLKPFEPYKLDEHTIAHPLRAAHCINQEDAFIYVIERNDCYLLYAADTGFPSDETWEYLRQFQLQGAIVEATYGRDVATREHLNISAALVMRRRMIAEGMLTSETPFVLTHLSPHWTPPHHIIEAELKQH
ncbi:MAG TPA: hypothetical protein EYP10_00150, partial [Armatimonadetes bacterium]|nr:hypothetical protein [Armatimonadota bacterium]